MNKRFKRLIVLARALVFCLFHGKATRLGGEPQRIIIVQLAKLGDMVCTTPMFRAVKERYPHAHLTVVGDTLNKQVLEGSSDVDDYLVWNGRDTATMERAFCEGRYDFACITGPNFDSLAALLLAGVPAIAVPEVVNGWSPYETKPYKVLKRFCFVKPHSFGAYAPREYLRLLEPIGIKTENTEKHLAYSPEAKQKVEDFLVKCELQPGEKLVGITPSAGNKIKKWPEERFAEIADYLIEKYQARVVIVAGPRDVEESRAMLAEVKHKDRIIDTTEHFSIEELKALIARLDLFIGVDTGPIYIAESFGIPTIDIVGPMDEHEQPPRGKKHLVVVPRERVRPELHIMNARMYDEAEAIRQVLSITTEEVKGAIDKLL
jgi:ADP-heptose:LPS heptosyltransferase